jgi:hypothetical protein
VAVRKKTTRRKISLVQEGMVKMPLLSTLLISIMVDGQTRSMISSWKR